MLSTLARSVRVDPGRRDCKAGPMRKAFSSWVVACGLVLWSGVQAQSSFQQWLYDLPPGRHVLAHVPPFAQWKKSDGSLASFQGAAYDLDTGDVYLQTGGHSDGWKDNIHRVNLMTGETLVTLTTPLTRRMDLGTKKDGTPIYVMLPEDDDFVTRHNGAGFIFKNGKLIIGGYTPTTNLAHGIMYYQGKAGLSSVFEIDVSALVDDAPRPIARPIGEPDGDYIGGYGFYALLPDGKVFIGTQRSWRIIGDDGKMLSKGQGNLGWNGVYLPALNTVAGITYNKSIVLAKLSPNMTRVMELRDIVKGSKDHPWAYHSGIVRWSDREVLINKGCAQMYVVNIQNGKVTPKPNVFYVEPDPKSLCRPFSRLTELAPGRYLYYPTDMKAHPVIYVKD